MAETAPPVRRQAATKAIDHRGKERPGTPARASAAPAIEPGHRQSREKAHADLLNSRPRGPQPVRRPASGDTGRAGRQQPPLEAPAPVEMRDLGARRGPERPESAYPGLLNRRPSGPRPIPRPATGNRTGLPDRLKTGIETLSGFSLDGVRVHYDSARPAELQALAFARGSDIHLGPGQERHLAHEAWHVVQQAQGRVKPTMQMKNGTAVNDQRRLEDEADRMGARALNLSSGNHLEAGLVAPSQVPTMAACVQRTTPIQVGLEMAELAKIASIDHMATVAELTPGAADLGDEDTIRTKFAATKSQLRGHSYELNYMAEKIVRDLKSGVGFMGAIQEPAGLVGADVTAKRKAGAATPRKSVQFKVVSTDRYEAVRDHIKDANEQIAGQRRSGEMPPADAQRIIHINIANPGNPYPFTNEPENLPTSQEVHDQFIQALYRIGLYDSFDKVKVVYEHPRKTSDGVVRQLVLQRPGHGRDAGDPRNSLAETKWK